MKKLQLLLAIVFTTALMGCQIEIMELPASNVANASEQAVKTVGLTLTWDIPVERENNEQLFIYEIGGYEIEYRKTGDVEYKTVVIDNGDISEFQFNNLEIGDYEFRIAAFDTNGLYSKFSDPTTISVL